MEFTGFYDKNNNKIFVGDILEDDIGRRFIVRKHDEKYIAREIGNLNDISDDLDLDLHSCIMTKEESAD